VSMIVLFLVAGVFGAVFFLVGDMGDIAFKTLMTVLALFVFSLFGLASSKILQNRDYSRYLAIVGLVFSSIALILILLTIWKVFDSNTTVFKMISLTSIVSFSIAHLSLLPGKMRLMGTKVAYFSTMVLIVVVASLLIYLVLVLGDVSDVYWRFLGFFGILDVSGTIVTPLLRRLKEK